MHDVQIPDGISPAPAVPTVRITAERTNGLAVAALVLGLVNITVGWFTLGLLGLVPIGLGLGALLSMREGDRGTGMAWTGIVLGAFPTALLASAVVVAGLV